MSVMESRGKGKDCLYFSPFVNFSSSFSFSFSHYFWCEPRGVPLSVNNFIEFYSVPSTRFDLVDFHLKQLVLSIGRKEEEEIFLLMGRRQAN